jgi:glutamate dehydrogenase/leucine dehydrogenase
MNLLDGGIVEFIELMRSNDCQRVWWVWDPATETVKVSHPFLREIAEWMQDDPVDYQRHEGVFLQIGQKTGALQGAFVHNTVRGQAAGGVRFWRYENLRDYLLDGIRLAKGMTHKNALAGLWWGGGKGVIARPDDLSHRNPQFRQQLFREYGDLMTSLRGCYVTAEDVGVNTADMAQLYSRSRFTTCIPAELGGSGNPSIPTARGVVCAMEAALSTLKMGDLQGKTIAIQGYGNVGIPMIRYLLERNVSRIVAADVDEVRREQVSREIMDSRLELRLVDHDDNSILKEEADILSPCATGGTLNCDTIPHIKAAIVCGAANNQLKDPVNDGPLLVQHGITYVPDFLANRMGIVNCADEQNGYVPDDQDFLRHFAEDWEYGIPQLTHRILESADSSGAATDVEAVRLAEDFATRPHPLAGHRGRRIIDGLIGDRWEVR